MRWSARETGRQAPLPSTTVSFVKHGRPVSVELRRVDGRSVRKTLSERISEAASGSVVYVSPVEVEGAKLRVKADHELGRQTPDWIQTVAQID